MAGNIQLPQDLLDIELVIMSDVLRKTLSDMLIEIETLKDRLDKLESV